MMNICLVQKKLTELGVSSFDLRYLVQQVKKIKS